MKHRLLGMLVSAALLGAAGSAGAQTAGSTAPTNYGESMVRLQQAAQKLREAVQAMAQQPAGPRRNEAMRQANDALFDTQQAMIQLPPELRTGQAR